MVDDPRSDRLDDLGRSVEAVLSAFEGERSPEPEIMAHVWRRCSEAFERFQAACAPGGPLPPELRNAVERVSKLHAVATSMLARQREGLVSELDKLVGVRARLGDLAAAHGDGRSCDVTG